MKESELIYQAMKSNHVLVMDAVSDYYPLELCIFVGMIFTFLGVMYLAFRLNTIYGRINHQREFYKEAVILITTSNEHVAKAVDSLTALLTKMQYKEEVRKEMRNKK